MESSLPQACQQLDHWLAEGKIRAIDKHLACQLVSYEQAASTDVQKQSPNDETRLVALLFASCATSAALGKGQVCYDMAHWPLPESHWYNQVTQDALAQCSVVYDADEGFKNPEKTTLNYLLVLEQGKLYLRRYYQYQQDILAQLTQRANQTISLNEIALSRDLQQEFPVQGADIDWQSVAAATACLLPFSVITGGPGTGKTTTVVRLLSVLLKQTPNMRIALAAPTGKAAARMTESIRQARHHLSDQVSASIPSESYTLHRLLGWSPRGFKYGRKQKLPFDTVLVDEASMIDLPMMAHLFAALASNTRLILLGDQDQLSSVEAGSVLADICNAGADYQVSDVFAEKLETLTGQNIKNFIQTETLILQNSVVKLTQSHRFKQDSGIGRLAKAVNAGDHETAAYVLNNYLDTVWLEQADWQHQLIEGYRHYCEQVSSGANPEVILEAFDDFQLLLALRKGDWGVERLNVQIESLLQSAGLLKNTTKHWYPGKAIMINHNDYDLNLFNGDIGIVLMIDGQERVVFRNLDGSLRHISPGRLPGYETAFAITVHKSQGSEYNNVMLILPPEWQSIITRELVYTGITRAKKSFSCVSSHTCWNKALDQHVQRASGLRESLW